MDIATIARSMVIELLSVDESLCGHQINMQGGKTMHTITIGIRIQGKFVTIVKDMVIYLRTTLEHTSRGTTIDG